MHWHLYLTFILAVTALMLFPGPNVALIIANSVTHGVRFGLITVAGTASAMVIQLTITALGLGAVLGLAGAGFEILRWAGVAYLIFMGIRCLKPRDNLADITPQAPVQFKIFTRGLIVSLTNPKTLLFYAAFFPQFITPGHNVAAQVAILATSFVLIALIVDCTWATAAHRARKFLTGRQKWANRLSGTVLIGAGLGLALARNR